MEMARSSEGFRTIIPAILMKGTRRFREEQAERQGQLVINKAFPEITLMLKTGMAKRRRLYGSAYGKRRSEKDGGLPRPFNTLQNL